MWGDGLRVGSLFSGIGGLDRGLESLGMAVSWQSEIDPAASVILEKQFEAPNLGDITKIDWKYVDRVNVLAGGFPCQDISIAGKGVGLEGERSGLWRVYNQAIRELRPQYVFIENVSALVTRGLDQVITDLARNGYVGSWGCVRASDIGAPHRRERVFIFARDTRAEANPTLDPYKRADLATAKQRKRVVLPERWLTPVGQLPLAGFDEPEIRVAEKVDWGPYQAAIDEWTFTAGPPPVPVDADGRLDPPFVEWMMGLPTGWTEGVTRHQRLRCLGNAVVPQQATQAWKAMFSGIPLRKRRAA